MRSLNFYHDQPLFGLDFGHSNLKVMQLHVEKDKSLRVLGYGIVDYPHEAIENGVIVKYNELAEALYNLFTKKLKGSISTRRVACTIPTSRTFSRPMKLPPMSSQDTTEAVHLEAEQYIPVPRSELYIDYEILRRDDKNTELLMVATPKNVIDSHIKLLESVGLDPVALEPTMNASARVFSLADPSHNEPSILVDFGSISVDLAVFDQTMFVNSTVVGGSEDITSLMAQRMNLSKKGAQDLKNNYGIGVSEKQDEIKGAIRPILENLVREIQKIIRYYDDRKGNSQSKISQIIAFGGGANMPGLNAYLSQELHLPARMLEPWHKINFGDISLPGDIEKSIYITVAGEAILNPREILP